MQQDLRAEKTDADTSDRPDRGRSSELSREVRRARRRSLRRRLIGGSIELGEHGRRGRARARRDLARDHGCDGAPRRRRGRHELALAVAAPEIVLARGAVVVVNTCRSPAGQKHVPRGTRGRHAVTVWPTRASAATMEVAAEDQTSTNIREAGGASGYACHHVGDGRSDMSRSMSPHGGRAHTRVHRVSARVDGGRTARSIVEVRQRFPRR